MFVLGLLAIVQMVFLPGFLVLTAAGIPRKSLLQTLVYAFALSGLSNYLIACALTAFGLYLRPAVFVLIAAEVACLVLLWRHGSFGGAARASTHWNLPTPAAAWQMLRTNTLINNAVLISAGVVFLIFLHGMLKSAGTIFNFADEIGSYNSWALQWTQNRMPNPIDTMGYPIAASANWSLTYLLLGNSEIQFFNKFAMGFFAFAPMLALADWARRRRSMVPVLAIVFFGVLIQLHLWPFIGEGPLDLPVACLSFLVLYAILDNQDNPADLRVIVLVNLLAASAAMMKQAGLYVVAYAAIWTIWTLYRNRAKLRPGEAAKTALWALAIILLIGLSWYGWIQLQIYEGRSSSESTYLMKGIHAGRTYAQRVWRAVGMLFGGGRLEGYPVATIRLGAQAFIAAAVALAFVSCVVRQTRHVFFLIVLPYFVFWCFFFSYERRTLALIFPFLAYCSATGFYFLLSKMVPESDKLMILPAAPSLRLPRRAAFAGIGVAVIALAAAGSMLLPSEKILHRQHTLQRQILVPELNVKLYQYYEKHGFSGKIASQYGVLKFLPELKAFYFPLRGSASYDLIKNLEEREDIHYLLMTIQSADSIYGFRFIDENAERLIQENIKSGRYRLLFMHGDMGLLKIR